MSMRLACIARTILAALCLVLMPQSSARSQTVQRHPNSFPALKHDLSPRLREIKQTPPTPGPPRVMPRLWARPPEITPLQQDPALQVPQGPQVSVTPGPSFDGICNAIQTCGTSSQQSATGILALPPDTNGAVGDTQFVQWINYAFAVFAKTTGTKQFGPIRGNALWTGFGAPCETNNTGDQIAQYDKAAHRWVMMQPVFTKPYAICVAVSTSSDFTNTYNRYYFYPYQFLPTTYFPDYPKLGIWPDGYYISIDLYTGQGFGGKFKGVMVCAFDRSAMLAGNPANDMRCFPPLTPTVPVSSAHLLPSDLDGTNPPPAGSPNYFMNFATDFLDPTKHSLNLWKFHVDFSPANNSTLTGPISISGGLSFNEAHMGISESTCENQ